MPFLQKFVCRNYVIDWDILPSMSTLRHLEIIYPRFSSPNAAVPVQLTAVLVALEALPNLTVLTLDKVPIQIDEPGRYRPSVTLHYLNRCSLNTSVSVCSALVEHLRTPPDMDLNISYVDRDGPPFAPLVSRLSGVGTISPPNPIISFMLAYLGWGTVKLAGWQNEITIHDSAHDRSGSFDERRSFSLLASDTVAERQLPELIVHLPFQHVRVLWLVPQGPSPSFVLGSPSAPLKLQSSFVTALHRAMPNVTDLRLDSGLSSVWAEFLRSTLPGHVCPWPSLKSLVLMRLEFRPDGDASGAAWRYDVQYVCDLRDSLLLRKSLGCATLERLVITQCTVEEADLELFTDCAAVLVTEDNEQPERRRRMNALWSEVQTDRPKRRSDMQTELVSTHLTVACARVDLTNLMLKNL